MRESEMKLVNYDDVIGIMDKLASWHKMSYENYHNQGDKVALSTLETLKNLFDKNLNFNPVKNQNIKLEIIKNEKKL